MCSTAGHIAVIHNFYVTTFIVHVAGFLRLLELCVFFTFLTPMQDSVFGCTLRGKEKQVESEKWDIFVLYIFFLFAASKTERITIGAVHGNMHRYFSSLFLASMHRVELRNFDKYLHIRRHKMENIGESEWRMGKCKYMNASGKSLCLPTLSPIL